MDLFESLGLGPKPPEDNTVMYELYLQGMEQVPGAFTVSQQRAGKIASMCAHARKTDT